MGSFAPLIEHSAQIALHRSITRVLEFQGVDARSGNCRHLSCGPEPRTRLSSASVEVGRLPGPAACAPSPTLRDATGKQRGLRSSPRVSHTLVLPGVGKT